MFDSARFLQHFNADTYLLHYSTPTIILRIAASYLESPKNLCIRRQINFPPIPASSFLHNEKKEETKYEKSTRKRVGSRLGVKGQYQEPAEGSDKKNLSHKGINVTRDSSLMARKRSTCLLVARGMEQDESNDDRRVPLPIFCRPLS